MTAEHRTLAEGRWYTLSLMEQLGNVGSEVDRALNWREKGNTDYSQRAFIRSLELMDLTLADPRLHGRRKELGRARELWCDFFYGDNIYRSTAESWRRYYLSFAVAARKKR